MASGIGEKSWTISKEPPPSQKYESIPPAFGESMPSAGGFIFGEGQKATKTTGGVKVFSFKLLAPQCYALW